MIEKFDEYRKRLEARGTLARHLEDNCYLSEKYSDGELLIGNRHQIVFRNARHGIANEDVPDLIDFLKQDPAFNVLFDAYDKIIKKSSSFLRDEHYPIRTKLWDLEQDFFDIAKLIIKRKLNEATYNSILDGSNVIYKKMNDLEKE